VYIIGFAEFSLAVLRDSDVDDTPSGFCVVELCAKENTSVGCTRLKGEGIRCCILGENFMSGIIMVRGKEAEKDTSKKTMAVYKMNECMFYQ